MAKKPTQPTEATEPIETVEPIEAADPVEIKTEDAQPESIVDDSAPESQGDSSAAVSNPELEESDASVPQINVEEEGASLQMSVPPPAGPSLLDKYTAHYPDWAKEFARKYFTKTVTQFLLYGNVRDLVPSQNENGERSFVSLQEFLVKELFAARDIVLLYDRSSGIHFADSASQKDFNRALSGYDTIFGTDFAKKLPKDPVRVLSVLQNYFRIRLGEGKRIACIIDYAETVIPMAEASMYSSDDRNALVFLQKWAHDPLFLSSDFTIALVAQNLSELNQQIVQSPYTAEIQLPIPGEAARRDFVDACLDGQEGEWVQHSNVDAAALASNTAGLGFIQLRSILADVLENHTELTFEALSDMKKEFIEAEAFGMLEFMETDLNLDMVAGHKEAKTHLRAAAKALKAGRSDVMPMGYLVSGPVGTGKTFSIMCFAGEIGIPMVKLKNFRSQWQGQTEANLEKILTLLQAMTPVAVMIDEADAALGNRDAGGDSGVSKRVFGQIAQFMSNSKNRGKVIWFLLTARPDYMPVDLKRQGRAEEHIALFYPSTKEEREELLTVMMKRTGVKIDMDKIPDALLNGQRTFSGADMEALLTRAKFKAASEDGAEGSVTPEILGEVVDDFMPPTYPLEVELQTLVAVLECTSQSLLPETYREMDREDIVRRVDELSHLVK